MAEALELIGLRRSPGVTIPRLSCGFHSKRRQLHEGGESIPVRNFCSIGTDPSYAKWLDGTIPTTGVVSPHRTGSCVGNVQDRPTAG